MLRKPASTSLYNYLYGSVDFLATSMNSPISTRKTFALIESMFVVQETHDSHHHVFPHAFPHGSSSTNFPKDLSKSDRPQEARVSDLPIRINPVC